MRTEVKVLGGLSITVEFTACCAEPDVGLMSDYFEDWRQSSQEAERMFIEAGVSCIFTTN